MSRTYEALKRAGNARGAGPDGPGLGRTAGPAIEWQVDPSRDVEYQRVRVWLTGAAARGHVIKTVLVAGCHSRTGATTTASLLAATLSEGKRLRVLLVDANFRTPALGSVFNVRSGDGLADVLDEGLPLERGLRSTERTNLSILPSGHVSRVPAEVFEGDAVDRFIAGLQDLFDFVIIDGAPILDFPDAHALAPKVDGLILVVEAEKTAVDDAQRAKAAVEQAGGRLLGVILNRQREYIPRRLRRLLGVTGG
jgi:capsular exopolysaccharide synthesis family protein